MPRIDTVRLIQDIVGLKPDQSLMFQCNDRREFDNLRTTFRYLNRRYNARAKVIRRSLTLYVSKREE